MRNINDVINQKQRDIQQRQREIQQLEADLDTLRAALRILADEGDIVLRPPEVTMGKPFNPEMKQFP